MAEFSVPNVARLLFVGALLLAMSTCHHPAVADTHGGYQSGGETPAIAPIKTPLDTTENVYTVSSVGGKNTPLSVTVSDASPKHYADVTFHNELALIWDTHETINFARPDGLVITVILTMGKKSNDPDTMTVLPPPGFVAIPAEVTVEERDDGIIEIHEAILG